MLKGPPSGLDQQTSEWRVNDGHDAEHYVVLVIERAGSWPGARYAHFVQRRADEINDQLVLVKQLAAQADTAASASNTTIPSTGTQTSRTQRIYHLELDALPPEDNDDPNDDDDNDNDSATSSATLITTTTTTKKRSSTTAGNGRSGRSKAPSTGLGTRLGSGAGPGPGRKPRQLEKTHLFVCTNPFALTRATRRHRTGACTTVCPW
jgi:hypothetical protein